MTTVQDQTNFITNLTASLKGTVRGSIVHVKATLPEFYTTLAYNTSQIYINIIHATMPEVTAQNENRSIKVFGKFEVEYLTAS